ncbi:hypothetical protein MGYG_07905 [Nannizzia gypsea CBS 118893]|uniref:Uncharacterized protein n=1 Tax=Arthroderma gypseum (strain ATCC MYA-4604 / CBS 118893) TaxID=535722 RepID=E4V4H9_ARTGP|nr:hypothetical protein MGYG_07905 [Nannizzia gypsea CBS 118893]EFR04903.1 hypothetical protein MGYG_07905 [Nannizzia gypsea CBS 118893]
MNIYYNAATWLNMTTIYGGCYAEAKAASGSSLSDGPTVTAAPTAALGRGSATSAIEQTRSPNANGVLDRAMICSVWKAASVWVVWVLISYGV